MIADPWQAAIASLGERPADFARQVAAGPLAGALAPRLARGHLVVQRHGEPTGPSLAVTLSRPQFGVWTLWLYAGDTRPGLSRSCEEDELPAAFADAVALLDGSAALAPWREWPNHWPGNWAEPGVGWQLMTHQFRRQSREASCSCAAMFDILTLPDPYDWNDDPLAASFAANDTPCPADCPAYRLRRLVRTYLRGAITSSEAYDWCSRAISDGPDDSDSDWRVLHDLMGDPFRPVTVPPAWRSPDVVALVAATLADDDFARLPVLADALEEAGCNDAVLLAHLRGPGPHVRGCWALAALVD